MGFQDVLMVKGYRSAACSICLHRSFYWLSCNNYLRYKLKAHSLIHLWKGGTPNKEFALNRPWCSVYRDHTMQN